MSGTRSSVISLYKRLIYLGREYPEVSLYEGSTIVLSLIIYLNFTFCL